MLVQDLISLSMRTSGILGVGQVALPQDVADTTTMLQLMMQQWRQRRWLVFRLDWQLIPLVIGKMSYTVGVVGQTPVPDVELADGIFRPANIQSCFLRQNVGSGPNSYPVDFPMDILGSRQQYDAIRLKFLQSWPAAIYYDPTIPNATMYIWPIPVQSLFSLYIAWQQAIDFSVEGSQSIDLDTMLPVESQLAMMYNLALLTAVNYKLPPDPSLEAAARSSLNVMRMTNYAMVPLSMPRDLVKKRRWNNPMGGFYPEVNAGVPVTTLG